MSRDRSEEVRLVLQALLSSHGHENYALQIGRDTSVPYQDVALILRGLEAGQYVVSHEGAPRARGARPVPYAHIKRRYYQLNAAGLRVARESASDKQPALPH